MVHFKSELSSTLSSQVSLKTVNFSVAEMSRRMESCHSDTVGVDGDGGSGGRWVLSSQFGACYLCGLVCVWHCAHACVKEDTGCNKPRFQGSPTCHINARTHKV